MKVFFFRGPKPTAGDTTRTTLRGSRRLEEARVGPLEWEGIMSLHTESVIAWQAMSVEACLERYAQPVEA